VTEAFGLQPDLHVFLCHLFGIYVDPYILFNTLFCFVPGGSFLCFFGFRKFLFFFVGGGLCAVKDGEEENQRI
jgi:hypothetical protein